MTADDALQTLRKDPESAEAWAALAIHLYNPLVAYVASLLLTFEAGPGETANDIAHDVLLAFYQRWPRVSSEISTVAALKAYLRTSCRNLLVDRYRHEKRAEQLIRFLSVRFRDVFAGEENTYSKLLLNEIRSLLPRDCAALISGFVERDLSPAEMAEAEGASPAAFYSRWYRCLQRAREVLVTKKGLPRR